MTSLHKTQSVFIWTLLSISSHGFYWTDNSLNRPEPERATALVVASSNIIALMLSEQRIASLSTRLPSSTLQLRADSTIHMSHMLILHARKWARFNGEPYVRTRTTHLTVTLFVFRAVFSTLGLTVLSYCISFAFWIVYYWTNKDGWMDGWNILLFETTEAKLGADGSREPPFIQIYPFWSRTFFASESTKMRHYTIENSMTQIPHHSRLSG